MQADSADFLSINLLDCSIREFALLRRKLPTLVSAVAENLHQAVSFIDHVKTSQHSASLSTGNEQHCMLPGSGGAQMMAANVPYDS